MLTRFLLEFLGIWADLQEDDAGPERGDVVSPTAPLLAWAPYRETEDTPK